MVHGIDFFSVILLFVIAIQDFKDRKISLMLFILLAVLFCWRSLVIADLKQVAIDASLSIGFVFLQLFLLTIYFSLRQKKITNVIDSYLGLGDIVFFFILTFLFSFFWFVIFFIVSMLISLVFFGLLSIMKKNDKLSIPLAGFMSLQLIGVYVIAFVSKSFTFRDNILLDQLTEKYLL